jgi:hypothetical protein
VGAGICRDALTVFGVDEEDDEEERASIDDTEFTDWRCY